ncbi:hypothetical protein F52700_9582 [Fusarium sp. NRRL 52700]|nr:hypothetical protein F52700_9582 [Fusarium sp. NRRL 52700]
MESAFNAPENSSRPDSTATSSQPINRPWNSAAGSSSRQSEGNRLVINLGQRSGENSLRPSARRGATPTPTQSVGSNWKEATGDFQIYLVYREMDRRREAQPNPTYISEERFPIEKFLGWRICDEDSVVIKVRWADGSPDTEEPEEIMHIDSAQTLLNFWRRQGGRGPATGLREHRVLKVLKSKRPKNGEGSELLLCQWIGLPASDRYTTWMSQEEVMDIALGQWLEFKAGVNNIFG